MAPRISSRPTTPADNASFSPTADAEQEQAPESMNVSRVPRNADVGVFDDRPPPYDAEPSPPRYTFTPSAAQVARIEGALAYQMPNLPHFNGFAPRTAETLLRGRWPQQNKDILRLQFNAAMEIPRDTAWADTLQSLIESVPYLSTAPSAYDDSQLLALKFVRFFAHDHLEADASAGTPDTLQRHAEQFALALCDVLRTPPRNDEDLPARPELASGGHGHGFRNEYHTAFRTHVDRVHKRLHRQFPQGTGFVAAPVHAVLGAARVLAPPLFDLPRVAAAMSKSEKNVSEALKALKETLKMLPSGAGLSPDLMAGLIQVLRDCDKGKHLRDVMKAVKPKLNAVQHVELDAELQRQKLDVHAFWGGSVVDFVARRSRRDRDAGTPPAAGAGVAS